MPVSTFGESRCRRQKGWQGFASLFSVRKRGQRASSTRERVSLCADLSPSRKEERESEKDRQEGKGSLCRWRLKMG